ncbi:aldo-keto reductase [Xylariaceae sp. FL0255]|nr:aldo-keto reductase [Xylariaceae sp. FL0255]
MDLPQRLTLNNGLSMPHVSIGTFQGDAGNQKVKDAVKLALHLGYRSIDGAAAYGNEKEIGEAIRESRVPREEIFVISKLAQTWHKPSDVAQGLDESLRDLQLEYVDLYLMHFPHAYECDDQHRTVRHPSGNGKPVIDYELSRNYITTWKAMESLIESGKAKAIGVSNFNLLKIRSLIEAARIIPAVNQVEIHPYLAQEDLVQFCQQRKITIMAHQPLGGRPVGVVRANPGVPPPTEDPKIIEIASNLGISTAQVCLSWAVQKGIPVVPKSVQERHMKENLELVKLSEPIVRTIDDLSQSRGPIRFLDPSPHIGFDIFDEEQDQPIYNSASGASSPSKLGG